MKKGDIVFYFAGCPDGIVKAKVTTAHKDGSATVQAQFFQKEGKSVGPFIGASYRLEASGLYASEAEVFDLYLARAAA